MCLIIFPCVVFQECQPDIFAAIHLQIHSEKENLDPVFDDRQFLNMMHFKSGLELTELQNMTVPEDDNISNDSNDFTEVENGQINR